MQLIIFRENIALVYIFFSETYFRSFSKGELIGFTEFLSNVGGLLGLFMGFSLISLAEVIYFITLRPLFAKRKEKQDRAKQDNFIRDRHFNTVYNNLVPNFLQLLFTLFHLPVRTLFSSPFSKKTGINGMCISLEKMATGRSRR